MRRSFRTLSAVALAALPLVGCSTTPPAGSFSEPRRQLAEVTDGKLPATVEDPILVYDPFERTNRTIYKFNAQFDRYVYLPVVRAYRFVTPRFVRTRVGNFFQNLGEVTTFANSVLQGKVEKAAPTLFRFMLNSTVGLFGLFDPASGLGLKLEKEDFGQTLGHWGVADGPYIVLPILGPSNLRDTVGTGVDFAYEYGLLSTLPSDVKNDPLYYLTWYGLWPINARYQQDFRYYSTGSPFEYDLVRYFVTQSRRAEIEK
jgi:phospholipid-binding lipoprotein MlaA